MERNKKQILVSFGVVILLPALFFAYWAYKPKPTIPELPIVGQVKLVESTDANGDFIWDTVYHSVPDFSFVSHMGDTVDKSIMEDKIVIADFFFTECPGICISMSKNMALLQEEFLNQEDIFLLSHTVDPARDSVAKLYDYAQLYDVNPRKWLLLTGTKPELYSIARQGYMVTADEGDGGEHDFIHSERLILVDKQQRIRGFYDGTSDEDVERLRIDTKRLLMVEDFPHLRNREEG